MDDSAKYLIRARITADGVVERTDVVGAVFGQTEGLLGDELDIRGLQESSKLGRIDVEVESENGRSFGRLTIGSNLDKVETAILAAALETIDRVGPCVASVEVTRIEDVRAAKRRAVVERAKQLLDSGFDESILSSAEIIDEVRESVRSRPIGEYAGLPAGPGVEEGDSVIVVEGRADVRRLLDFGIENTVAVEGTNVPEPVADLTRGRTATAFLDGDRGGDLILRELAQVGAIDYVARAPSGQSVEDLDREAVLDALREKRPLAPALESIEDPAETAVTSETDGESTPLGEVDDPSPEQSVSGDSPPSPGAGGAVAETVEDVGETTPDQAPSQSDELEDVEPQSIPEHGAVVIGEGTGRARLLDADGTVLTEGPAEAVTDLLEEVDGPVDAVIVDAEIGQPVLDEAATRSVQRIVARAIGEVVKTPADVRVDTWSAVEASERPPDS